MKNNYVLYQKIHVLMYIIIFHINNIHIIQSTTIKNIDWHTSEHFQNIESLHVYDNNKGKTDYIEIEINNENIKLEFDVNEMVDHSARMYKASTFVKTYLLPLIQTGLKFNGIIENGMKHAAKNPNQYLNQNHIDDIAFDIAKQILQKVENHVQTYAYGPIAIKKRWAHGTNLVYHRGALTIAPAIERFGEWEEKSIEMMSSFLCRNDINRPVFDVGANQGLITFALHHFNPNLEYHTFEPQKMLHNLINANLIFQQQQVIDGNTNNLAVSTFDNVYTHNVAVGNIHEILKIPRLSHAKIGRFSSVNFWENYTENIKDIKYDNIQSITLSDIVFPDKKNTLRIQCPQLIKIDVEGFEEKVIKGSEKIIKQCKKAPILYFESHNGRNVTTYLNLIIDMLGYDKCYHHIFSYIRKDNYHRNVYDYDIFSSISDASSNLLCFKRDMNHHKWPTCNNGDIINNINFIENAISNRELVLVTNDTINGLGSICNFEIGEVNENTREWCISK